MERHMHVIKRSIKAARPTQAINTPSLQHRVVGAPGERASRTVASSVFGRIASLGIAARRVEEKVSAVTIMNHRRRLDERAVLVRVCKNLGRGACLCEAVGLDALDHDGRAEDGVDGVAAFAAVAVCVGIDLV